jgi:ribosomal-protein-alanine N-acetyltransferase
MRWNVHDNLAVTEEWMKVCEQIMADETRYEWGIILKDSGEPMGSIGAFLNDNEPNRYELGYVLGKKYWNQGYATEALQGVMDFLIHQVGIRHFICSHAKDNPASGAVMRHVGFRYQKDGTYQSFDGLRKYESKIYYLDI